MVQQNLAQIRRVGAGDGDPCCTIGWDMGFDDYKLVLYRNRPEGWVAEIPSIPGCYALMPTREEALDELARVFEMISAEYREKGLELPSDTTGIVHA